jgi:hypothetical protein
MIGRAEEVDSITILLLKQDTPTGVSGQTLDLLSQQTGMSQGDVIHMALRQMADRCLPRYELDDGPLTDEQRAASRATGIPKERFTKKLF